MGDLQDQIREANLIFEEMGIARERAIAQCLAELGEDRVAVRNLLGESTAWFIAAASKETPQEVRAAMRFASLGAMLVLHEWSALEMKRINRKAAENV